MSAEIEPEDEHKSEILLVADPGEEVSEELRSGVRALLRNESEATIKIEIVDLEGQENRAVPGAEFPVQISGLNDHAQKGAMESNLQGEAGSVLELRFPYLSGLDSMEPVMRLANDLYEIAFPLNFNLVDFISPDSGEPEKIFVIEVPGTETIPPDDPIVIALEGSDSTCGMEAYDFQGPLNHNEVGDRTPVILIHGWRSTKTECKSFENFDAVEHMSFYINTIENDINDPSLNDNVAIFTFRYPTFVEIKEAAEVLAGIIENAGWENVAIVGHSRGGLVGRVTSSMLSDESKKITLITLGTPHEGAIIAEEFDNLTLMNPVKFFRCGENWWDSWRVPFKPLSIQFISTFILDKQGASHMTPSAVQNLPDPALNTQVHLIGSFLSFEFSASDIKFSSLPNCLGYLWYEDQGLFSDGIVETTSTLPVEWDAQTNLFRELDHGHLREGKSGQDEDLKQAIRLALLSALDDTDIDNEHMLCEGDRIIFDQKDLDEFASDECTKVEGDVIIGGEGSSLTNLTGMESLRMVTGSLIISENSYLTDITTLSEIIEIGSGGGNSVFRIQENSTLTELPAFSTLQYTRNLIIDQNQHLNSIGGFPALEEVGFGLGITNNENLTEIPVFPVLNKINAPSSGTGSLHIYANPNLVSVGGFPTLSEVGELFSLLIQGNDNLINTPEFPLLRTVSNFQIIDNHSMTSIEGFPMLKKVGGHFEIRNNTHLSSIPDFYSLESIEGRLWIRSNNGLISIGQFPNLRSVRGWLGTVPDAHRGILIQNNPNLKTLGGFPTLEIISAGRLEFQNNDELSSIPDFISLQEISNGLEIKNNSKLIAVPYFPQLVSTRSLEIENNDALTTIPEFSNLVTSRNIFIQNHLNLKNLGKFPVIEKLTGGALGQGGLNLRNNQELVSIPEFPQLQESDGFNISGHPKLELIEGFPQLKTITGTFRLSANRTINSSLEFPVLESVGGSFQIWDNLDMKVLPAFPALHKIGENLQFQGNESLAEVTGLKALEEIGGGISVSGNGQLLNLDGLSNISSTITNLFIDSNQSLENIYGLQNLGGAVNAFPAVEGNFRVTNNPKLSQSEAEELADQLGVGGSTTISGNLEE